MTADRTLNAHGLAPSEKQDGKEEIRKEELSWEQLIWKKGRNIKLLGCLNEKTSDSCIL